MAIGGRFSAHVCDAAALRGKLALFAGAMAIVLAPQLGHASPRENPLPPLPHMGAPRAKSRADPPSWTTASTTSASIWKPTSWSMTRPTTR